MTTRDETTCIKDSQIPIGFDSSKMFCYEPNFEYIPTCQCESRNPQTKCKAFESIKEVREKEIMNK